MIQRKSFIAAFVLVLMATVGGVQAAEQTTTTFGNDRDRDLNHLNVIVDGDGQLQGLNYATTLNETKPPSKTDKRFTLAQLASQRGIVLDGDASHDVFVLQGALDVKRGGDLTYRYLTNGMTGSYAECKIGLRRSSQGQWYVLNLYTKQPVAKALIKTWALGIAEVQGLCPKP